MVSNFSAARVHLQRAYDCLKGGDKVSGKTREALDILIDVIATAESHKRLADHVIYRDFTCRFNRTPKSR